MLVNYNNWYDTIECIESLFKLSYPNFQIIVVDNHSVNDSIECLKLWAEGRLDVWVNPDNPLRSLSFPPVSKPVKYTLYKDTEFESMKDLNGDGLIFIQSGYNGGFSFGNNLGIKYALKKGDADFFWFLNNDTVVDSNALSCALKIFDDDNKIGLVGSKIKYYHRTDTIQALCGCNKIIPWDNKSFRWIAFNSKDAQNFREGFEIEGALFGASMLARKECLSDAGLFDEKYFMQVEEYDFCFMVRRCGWKIFCCCKSIIYHKVGASTGYGTIKSFFGRKSLRNNFKRFLQTPCLHLRNRFYFTKKFFGTFHFYLFFIINFYLVLRLILGIIVYDDEKFKRIRFLLIAVFDGIRGKMGKPEWINS
ncbi:glycosyltransferase family 2 protein [Thermodesulfobium narugense]|uniref:glycosyltransferase family 2 protein n=1 Tax=Thermodesulfobium narugense TaxID=184064 RepID=UPI003898EE7E